MKNLKKDFPIFKNNPGLIFFDSGASSQKPKYVIDAISEYLSNSYSNIHRGLYDISINSEKLYFDSKKKVAQFLGVSDFKEIIYTYNANYALNIITQTLRLNKVLKSGDKVLLSIVEHHANIVPWLILKEEIGIEIEFVKIDENYDLDLEDFKRKYDEKVKVIAITQVSNVTGEIFNLEEIGKLKRLDTIFIIDASQSFPHIKVDVKKLNCDFLFFTAHKVMADSGLGVIWGKSELLNKYNPIFSGGGAINEVKETCFKSGALPFKFEPGTPNISGAISLLKALEYIENIGGYKKIEEIEKELIKYSLEKFNSRNYIKLIGNRTIENRVGVFSFYIDGIHALDIADKMAENNVCIRAGQHCTEPFMDYLKIKGLARMSLYIYNTFEDIDKFFEVLDDNFK
ncbi:MAG: aminotransferase class V-fold PLP-dependent enzyme [Candidatus Gracilibacteria bacterium]|nr:aminotransferase class V-fold PLP-dependent enzyme [Candidatus Gracilibacteria bacterium]